MSENVSPREIDIYGRLKNEIIMMDILPGQALGEIETAKRFGVSRTPIRDAFKRLLYDGLLEIVPQKGTFVTHIDLAKVSDIMFIREKVELSVAKELAGHVSDSQLLKARMALLNQKRLIDSCGEDGSGYSRDVAKRFTPLDDEFHEALFAAAGRGGIRKILMSIDPQYDRYRRYGSQKSFKSMCRPYQGHADILAAILDGNADALDALYDDHICGSLKAIGDMIDAENDYFL